jgi:hypothetical protein
MSVIASCYDILLLMQRHYYVVLSTISKSTEIQRAPILVSNKIKEEN